MTRDEKIETLILQLDDNNKLRELLRMVFKDAINNLTDENLDKIYLALNPVLEPE